MTYLNLIVFFPSLTEYNRSVSLRCYREGIEKLVSMHTYLQLGNYTDIPKVSNGVYVKGFRFPCLVVLFESGT